MFEGKSRLRALAYLIVLCRYCGTPRYVREGERGFKCVKCSNYVELGEAKVIKRAQTIRDAVYIVKELKLPEELRGKIPHRGP
jgi:tRNA(Ile2) C34 agmatinyltransferase TiaS